MSVMSRSHGCSIHTDTHMGLLDALQHADKLAALDRHEADLKAQQHSLAKDAQACRDKEGERTCHGMTASCIPLCCCFTPHPMNSQQPQLRAMHDHLDAC